MDVQSQQGGTPDATPQVVATPDGGKNDSAAKPQAGAKRRESVRLVWNTKPKRAPNPRDLEFQPAEVVYPNRAAERGQDLLFPRT